MNTNDDIELKLKQEADNANIGRTEFITRLSLGIAAISAAVMAVPVVAALVAPLLERNRTFWRTVGHIDDFPVGTTKLVNFDNADAEQYAGMLTRSAAWLRHNENDTFTAFAVNCTHLGCPVRWLPGANLFMCPCHGGVFYADGTVASGPPPRPLFQYPVRLQGDEVQILTSPLPIA